MIVRKISENGVDYLRLCNGEVQSVRPLRRNKSVSDSLNLLGTNVEIKGKFSSFDNLRIEELADRRISNSDGLFMNFDRKDISVISEAANISGDDMEHNSPHDSSTDSHAESLPSAPRRRHSQKPKSNGSVAAGKWVVTVTDDNPSADSQAESSDPKGSSILRVKSRDEPKPLRKVISFQDDGDESDEDSDFGSSSESPKKSTFRNNRKNSMSPDKAFMRNKAIELKQ